MPDLSYSRTFQVTRPAESITLSDTAYTTWKNYLIGDRSIFAELLPAGKLGLQQFDAIGSIRIADHRGHHKNQHLKNIQHTGLCGGRCVWGCR